MTHDEAVSQATQRQRADQSATWKAVQRGDDWIVVRIAVAPAAEAMGTATKPPPPTPHDKPFSDLERVVRQYG